MSTFLRVICCLLLAVSVAQAHRLNVFAWVEDGTLMLESSFSSGRKAQGAAVSVQGLNGQVLFQGQTDTQGAWAIRMPDAVQQTPQELLVVVNAGEGHRGQWPIRAEEYAAGADLSDTQVEQPENPGVRDVAIGLGIILAIAVVIRWRRH